MSGHLFDTIAKSIGTKEPSDSDGLEETDPEQSHSRTAIEVHQLESIDAALQKKEDVNLFYSRNFPD